MNSPFRFGPFLADPATGELIRDGQRQRLEPKVMQLLAVLAERSPRVVSREALMQALWPDSIVTEDALARSLLKLRRALNDNARSPDYIETLPRRGYRFLLPATPLADDFSTAASAADEVESVSTRPGRVRLAVFASVAVMVALAYGLWPASDPAELPLLARAHDHYYQFNEADNERAHLLYERVLGEQPDQPEALAGQANTLIQRLIRWPDSGPAVPEAEHSVTAALASDRLDSPWARETLARAQLLVDRAVRSAPESGFAWKAHGLLAALQGDLERADARYRRALAVDPGNWEAAFNLGELHQIAGDDASAIDFYQRAYGIMEDEYSDSAQRIGPWQPDLGVLIAGLHSAQGNQSEAEAWYRTVLERTPLHVEATLALAAARTRAGDDQEAETLCRELISRIGPLEDCRPFLPPR
jgi:DNA-binding winged helix-turn-helix (wHTH) protein